MWQIVDAFSVLLLACCGVFVDSRISCNSNGLGSCNFQRRHTCSWTITDNSWVLKEYYVTDHEWTSAWLNVYLAFVSLIPQGYLHSRRACSTQSERHCLKFWYYFEEDYVAELKVFLKQDGDGGEVVWKVNSSSLDSWDDANVPIKTSKSFKVTIQVDRLGDDAITSSVNIDLIRYEKQPCNIQPSSARPAKTVLTKTSTTTTIPPNTVTTTPTTTTTSIKTTMQATTHEGLKPKPVRTTAASGQKKPASSDRMVRPTESSNSVGIIVGAVVAVVIVVAVAVLVFILLRRKQLHFWKACFKDGKQTEDVQVTASHNAIYSIDTGDPDAVEMTPADPEQHGNFRLVTRISIQATDNQYSVIRKPGQPSLQDPSIPEYSVVNKPQTIPPVRNKAQSNPYELGDESADFSTKQSPENNVYNHIHPGTRESVDYESLSTSSVSPATGDYSRLVSPEVKAARDPGASETPGLYCNVDTPTRNTQRPATTTCGGQAEDYNSLDFDGKSNAEASTDADKYQVYSHLNEGDEDAYNEVDREKRKEVIDGDYSHVQ